MRLSDAELQWMQTRLAQRYAAAGREAREALERKLAALPPDQSLLTSWCYAASPLSDWANYDFSFFSACAAHALFLWEQSPEVRALPEQLFLNYVLHPRVNEEELCDCRDAFYAQLEERIRGRSAREAILAVNLWNAEQVCYRATDVRTISALGAQRSGFGRCGEESAFAVNTLRAVGIPARQVYTPRWAHCDDNHAWAEAFCDGAWHYLGACEPEPELDRGWFTGAASRAILVHSRLFGRPAPDDAVISEDGAVTFLNQTARYAPVRPLRVLVREPDGSPAAGAEVTFGIVNASQIFPAAVIRTDSRGAAQLVCGYGDLALQSRKSGWSCEALCPAAQQTLELTLAQPEAPSGRWEAFTIHAPKAQLPARKPLDPAEKARAAEQLAAANEKRRLRTEAAYDPARVQALRAQFGYGPEVEAILRAACRNFDALAEFLAEPAFAPAQKLALLQTLSEKDLRDVCPEVLREALALAADDLPQDVRALREILCPRIGTEPLARCRAALLEAFSQAQKQEFRREPARLWQWIRENIRYVPEAEYRQLITLPAGAVRLRCADLRAQRLLFVAACRALGVAARLDPHSGAAEYRSGESYLSPEDGQTVSAALPVDPAKYPVRAGGLKPAADTAACRHGAPALRRSALAAAAVRRGLPGAWRGGAAGPAQRRGGISFRRKLSFSRGGADGQRGAAPGKAARRDVADGRGFWTLRTRARWLAAAGAVRAFVAGRLPDGPALPGRLPHFNEQPSAKRRPAHVAPRASTGRGADGPRPPAEAARRVLRADCGFHARRFSGRSA